MQITTKKEEIIVNHLCDLLDAKKLSFTRFKRIAETFMRRQSKRQNKIVEDLKKSLQTFFNYQLKENDFFVNAKNWTAADLILRRYLNDGCDGFGIINIFDAYDFIITNKQSLIANNMISKKGTNNSGFDLWFNYNF